MAAIFDGGISAQELADMLPTGVAILNQNDESIISQSIHPEDFDRIATAYFETSRSKGALRIEFRARSRVPLWRVLMLAPLDEADL
ncbi:hypothetical protein N7507_010018 [Penicillium longicatenatum]|nr:hypothetical protein N7507_010018 [Penicillium longicatenatum]